MPRVAVKSRLPLVTLMFLLGTIAPTTAQGENWPAWRGPGRDGLSKEKGVPTQWSKTENVLWRAKLPGVGGATPIVWEDRIFVTSADGKDLVLLAFDAKDGKQLWRQVVATGNRAVRGEEGNLASPTPSTDGRHVWSLMGEGTLGCYTTDGEEVWKLKLSDRYGKLKIDYGMSASPILDKDRLYLQLIHGEGNPTTEEAAVVCLEAATGKELWKTSRVTGARQENEQSYASPAIYRDGQREFLLTHGGDYIMAHSLDDGSELWRYFMNYKGRYHPTLRFVASPLAVPDLIVVPSAKNGPVVALRPDIKGDVSEVSSARLWKRDSGTPDVPSPLAVDGLVYLCRENGNLVCLDAASGEEFYEKRTTADKHRASPVYADGHIYTTSRRGVVTVTKVGKDFKMVAQNDLDEPISASPAISNGRIYLRTFDALYAIGPK